MRSSGGRDQAQRGAYPADGLVSVYGLPLQQSVSVLVGLLAFCGGGDPGRAGGFSVPEVTNAATSFHKVTHIGHV